MAPHPTFPGVDHLSFNQICQLPYREQAVWVLNGFWDELQGEAETIWSAVELFAELDLKAGVPRGTEGFHLDQVSPLPPFSPQQPRALPSLQSRGEWALNIPVTSSCGRAGQ
jgi:hypothetical protein